MATMEGTGPEDGSAITGRRQVSVDCSKVKKNNSVQSLIASNILKCMAWNFQMLQCRNDKQHAATKLVQSMTDPSDLGGQSRSQSLNNSWETGQWGGQ